MGWSTREETRQDGDALRLLALRRVPRCKNCPRLRALDALLGEGRRHSPLPPIPHACRWQICAPLVEKLDDASKRPLVMRLVSPAC